MSYEHLVGAVREAHLLSTCRSLLEWDLETYMPPGGAKHRADQAAQIATLVHRRRTDPRIGEWLDELSENGSGGDGAEAANVRELRHDYERTRRIPADLKAEQVRASALARGAWVEARGQSSFEIFEPHLSRLLDLKRQEAEAVGYATEPYDALLDDYDRGETAAKLTALFDPLRVSLVDLLRRIQESGREPRRELLDRDYPVERQQELARIAASTVGFDMNEGRIDTTAHPFCTTIGPGDVRLTTRYNPRSFADAFFGILHEAGHGMYEQGLDAGHAGLPMGSPASSGVHESQSRLWENQVGRSRAFWRFILPKVKELFPEALGDASLDDVHFAINDVRPSHIRVEADEVTYNLHIFLRFDLERALFRGDLSVADVPGAWNERFAADFGLEVPDHSAGCLQDIHWSLGAFGYFPGYTLGNVYSAQIFAQARKELGDLDEAFARGEFLPLRDWLRKKIHAQGRRLLPGALIEDVCGAPPGPAALVEHLEQKFTPLYEL